MRETTAMSQATLKIRRRVARPTPMSRLRLGATSRSAAASLPFPGISVPGPEGSGRRSFAAAAATGLHALAAAALLAVAWLAPPPEEEEVVPIELLQELPTPVVEDAPAPAPKALAERRTVEFAPAAQAVAPQVVNPTVVAQAAPRIDAKSLDVAALQSSVSAPREIQRSSIAVDAVQAVTNLAAPTAPRQIDVAAAAPALRGPIQPSAPVGPSVGPRAIAAPSETGSIGTGSVVRSGAGSSVREGAVTGRDVLGSADGQRLANVNTRVGDSNMRGPGGEGTTLGGDAPDCDERPEVKAYREQVRQRTLARWVAPPSISVGSKATLSWKLDVSGSATAVQLVNASTNEIGSSVVDALRAASPFPPMSDRVRCLANRRLTGTFFLTPEG
jgi:hypothetical protein